MTLTAPPPSLAALSGNGATAMTTEPDDHGGRPRANGWRIALWSIPLIVLLTPLVAMRFNDEVDWSPSDFVFLGALMGLVGAAAELAVRRSVRVAYRAGAGVALAATFFLVWINGALGIIGDDGGVNALYLAVPLVALIGAVAARFRPAGMVWAMVAAAAVQAAVPVGVAIGGLAPPAAVGAPEVLVLTGFFVAAWLMSATLFRQAGTVRPA
jgi:hypothetical protein